MTGLQYQVAMRTTKVIYQYILVIGSFSHTLDRVGENMKKKKHS